MGSKFKKEYLDSFIDLHVGDIPGDIIWDDMDRNIPLVNHMGYKLGMSLNLLVSNYEILNQLLYVDKSNQEEYGEALLNSKKALKKLKPNMLRLHLLVKTLNKVFNLSDEELSETLSPNKQVNVEKAFIKYSTSLLIQNVNINQIGYNFIITDKDTKKLSVGRLDLLKQTAYNITSCFFTLNHHLANKEEISLQWLKTNLFLLNTELYAIYPIIQEESLYNKPSLKKYYEYITVFE